MFQLPTHPLSLWQTVLYSVRLFEAGWKKVIILSFLAAVAALAPIELIFSTLQSSQQLFSWSAWLNYAPFIGLSIVLQMSIIQILHCMSINSTITPASALKNSVRKLPELIFMAIQYCVIILAGTMLLVIPGVILTISLLFGFILLIAENFSISKSITTSHKLVWKHWTRTLILIGFMLTAYVSLSLFCLAVGLLLQNNFFQHVSNPVIITLTQIIAQTLGLPFIFSYMLIMLEDLKLLYASE